MPKRFQSHRGPTCNVGRRSHHQTYDKRRYEDETLGPVARFRNTSRWQKVRARQRARFPLCADPFGDHAHERGGSPACECVHHVIGLAECLMVERLADLGCDDDNLSSLCWACHNRVEGLYERDRYAAVRLFLSVEREAELWSRHGVTTTMDRNEASDTRNGPTDTTDDGIGIPHTISTPPSPTPSMDTPYISKGDIRSVSHNSLHRPRP